MTSTPKARLDGLCERAARRSMTVKPAPEGWALASPFRTVCIGTLANITDWLTAAEQRDHEPLPLSAAGERADG
ncbi:hypothetical protein ACFWPX_11215 [Nocardia sp. NPDC058518]|uniref:hypothetical protein n=1 Tax=Nocardia sp. NPDC058518 TaxID=3346534 RepID=UPI003647C9C1